MREDYVSEFARSSLRLRRWDIIAVLDESQYLAHYLFISALLRELHPSAVATLS